MAPEFYRVSVALNCFSLVVGNCLCVLRNFSFISEEIYVYNNDNNIDIIIVFVVEILFTYYSYTSLEVLRIL